MELGAQIGTAKNPPAIVKPRLHWIERQIDIRFEIQRFLMIKQNGRVEPGFGVRKRLIVNKLTPETIEVVTVAAGKLSTPRLDTRLDRFDKTDKVAAS